jgi:HEAT repeat protein
MSDNGRSDSGRTDVSPEERVAYLESLLQVDEVWADYGAVFEEFLDDEDAQVRTTAIEGLWYYPDAPLIDRLIELAETDPSPAVRAAAISGLGIYIYEGEMADYDFDWGPMTEVMREDELPQADFERVRDYLLATHEDETRALDERRFALEALSFLSDPRVADLIAKAYNRPERDMKLSAIFAMGRSGLTRWTESLAKELYSAEQEIQREAIRAVGEIGLAELGNEIWRLTFAEDQEIKLQAIEALGQTGWQGAFERLEELTLDPDPEVSEVAEEALDEWLWISEMLQENEGVDEEFFPDWDDEDEE